MTAERIADEGKPEILRGSDRLLFVDNIRWTMIVLVLSMHACVTYSPFGNWYYRDPLPMSFGTTLAFAVYQSVLQAFFMSLLFFIAGYFAASSFERKGPARFVRDRAVRLGLPTLLYMLAIGPVTEYFLAGNWGHGGFTWEWLRRIANGRWLSETGPMWFCAALLGFSLIYAALRAIGVKETSIELRDRFTSDLAIAGFIVVMTGATFLARIVEPQGKAVLNMQLGDFPQYLLMFAAGFFAFRANWLQCLPDRLCARWGLVALLLGSPFFVLLIVFGGALEGHTAAYSGGFNWVSAGKCLWEAVLCVGVSLALIALYRRFLDRQGAMTRWLSENAFGVYLIHPPVLVGGALLLHGAGLAAIPKAAVLMAFAAIGSFALTALLLRRTPGLRILVR